MNLSQTTYLNRKVFSLLAYIICFLFFISSVKAQTTIPVTTPNGGFRLDGNVEVSGSVGDWLKRSGSSSTGGSIFPQAVIAPYTVQINNTTPSSIWYQEEYNSSNDFMFGSGAKFVDDPTKMVLTKGKPPSKNDIQNAFYHVALDDMGVPYLFIAGDRFSTTGTSYIDFEFLQGELVMNSGGTALSYINGTAPSSTMGGRTEGDIVVSMEYSGGGATALAYVYRWEKNASGVYAYVQKSTFSSAATNINTANMYAGAFGRNTYSPYAFVEAALNLTDPTFSSGSGGCVGTTFKTIFIKTKASNSETAALKDFIPPQKINLQLGGVSLDYTKLDCTTGKMNPIVGNTTIKGGTFSATPSGLSIDPVTGVIDYVKSENKTYTVTFTKTVAVGCTQTPTFTLTVNNNLPVTLSYGSLDCSKGTMTANLVNTTASGGVFSSTTGLVLNTGTGEIDYFKSTNGTYEIKFTKTMPSGCIAEPKVSVEIKNNSPVSINYNSLNCLTGKMTANVVNTTISGGTFTSSPAGLVMSASTGEIDYFKSTNGIYTIKFTKTMPSGCTIEPTTTVSVSISAPVISCPGDRIVECGSAANYSPLATGYASGSSSTCGNISAEGNIIFSDATKSVGCNIVITRTWTVTDPNTGLSATCVQKILVRDNTAPVASGETITLTCGQTATIPNYSDNCTSRENIEILISVAPATGVDAGGTLACPNIVRTITFVDESGNSTTVLQTVKYSASSIVNTSSLFPSGSSSSNSFSVKTYPNPFSSQMTFDVKSDITGPLKLILFDITGRSYGVVYQGNVYSGEQKQINIDGSKFNASTFVYQLIVGDKIVSGKMIKQNHVPQP